jgi:hypothetical protein
MKLGLLLWIAGGGGGEGRTDTMEADSGKLFVGGISWETDEDRLREYFGRFGEVTEAVIMRDRNTGRARGFGFVVFADSGIAERVTMDKHMIDGRMVLSSSSAVALTCILLGILLWSCFSLYELNCLFLI